MVKMRIRKTMKRNKIKKNKKHSRKHQKTIKRKTHYKRIRYSRRFKGGDICLKEVTDKIPQPVNRIGDENTNLPKKSSWGLGTLFGNKKTDTKPIEEPKIVEEKTENIIENTLVPPPSPELGTETEEINILPPIPGPGDAGFVKPPPPSTPNPYLNPIVSSDDITKKNIEIMEDTMPPRPPPTPPTSENPSTSSIFDKIKEGVKLKSLNEKSNIPPSPPKKSNLSDVADIFQKKLEKKNKNIETNEEENDEDKTWNDSEGGKSRKKIRTIRKKGKNSRRKMKK